MKRLLTQGSDSNNKKQKNGDESEEIKQLKIEIEKLKYDKNLLIGKNNELKTDNNQLVSDNDNLVNQVVRNNKYTQNRQLIVDLVKGFELPTLKNGYDRRRILDLNSGELTWWCDELVQIFDQVYLFDAFKNSASGSGYTNNFATKHNLTIGTYDELETLRRATTKFCIVLSDLPYVQNGGDYTGLNSGKASSSIKNKDHRYGIDGFTLPSQYLRYMMLNHLLIAVDMLKEDGILLLKLQRKCINLSESVIEASIGTGLMYLGEIPFGDTSLGDPTKKVQSQLLMFRRVMKPAIVQSEVYPGHNHLSLQQKWKILREESYTELFGIGNVYSKKLNSMRICFQCIFDVLTQDNKQKLLKRMGSLGKDQYNRAELQSNQSINDKAINWNPPSNNLLQWKQSSTQVTMIRFQQKIIDESTRWVDVSNMCCIAFALLLKSNGVSIDLPKEEEKKNRYAIRRKLLKDCNIVGNAQNRFTNGSIKRLYTNAKYFSTDSDSESDSE